MPRTREQLIDHSKEIDAPSDVAGRAFLLAEDTAVGHTEYSCDAIPTFAQIPAVSRIYMQNFAPFTPQQIEHGLSVRQLRAREAVNRSNTLFFTEQALAMEQLVIDREIIEIDVPEEVRAEQLRHLASIALQPHVDMRLILKNAILPDFESLLKFDMPDGSQAYFTERDRQFLGPITDEAEIESFQVGLDYLDAIALDHRETRQFIDTLAERL